MGGQSRASCHQPGALFADRQLHDVGSGGVDRTPTPLGGNLSAPNFHDGRYADLAAVVRYDLRGTIHSSMAAELLAAATAVAQWVFTAPRRDGEPLDVMVQVPFDFAAPAK